MSHYADLMDDQKGRAILADFERLFWGLTPEPTPIEKQRRDDAYRHMDPRAAGSTDPLHRFCTEHNRAWENMDGYFSACSECFQREWEASR